VTVQVRCREGEDPADDGTSRMVTGPFVGQREHVDGLAEAMGDCLNRYLNARREGLPDAKAAAALVALQLHRPADPLWDPDPQLAQAANHAVLGDPDRASIEQLIAAPIVEDVATGSVGAGIGGTGIDTVSITGIDLGALVIDIPLDTGFG
jgi:hypothetical protein